MAMKKITVLGDIMCEPTLLKAGKTKNGYDFEFSFESARELFLDSDFVIGNLETPLAGKDAGFTGGLFSFNAPDEFAEAIKNAGIDLVLTANNHCLDRGMEGLRRTLKVLREKELLHAGSCESAESRTEATYVLIDDLKCAVIAYTYGTNYLDNRIELNEEQQKQINLLRPQKELYFIPQKKKKTLIEKFTTKILRHLKEEKQFYIKKVLGMKINEAHADDNLIKESCSRYLDQLKDDIRTAKENADLVLFCPHVGGQFNSEPGAFTEYVIKKALEFGCDAIIASHPHVVQKAEWKNGVPCFYSLGNFLMSPNSVYLLHENMPEYGIAAHIYIEDKRIHHISFSIYKILETKAQPMRVVPIKKLVSLLKTEEEKKSFMREVKYIYETVAGTKTEVFNIKSEYIIDRRS